MTRTTAREIAIQLGFAAAATGEEPHELLDRFFEKEHYAEFPDEKQLAYITRLVTLIDEHRDEIDEQIRSYARGWRLERMSKTALAVLRCCLCEIMYMEDIPDSAAINEAVELAKGYDEPDTVAFVNGVLGGYMRGRSET